MNDAILKGFISELDKISGQKLRIPKTSSTSKESEMSPGGRRARRPSGGFSPTADIDVPEGAAQSREFHEAAKERRERPIRSVLNTITGYSGQPTDVSRKDLLKFLKESESEAHAVAQKEIMMNLPLEARARQFLYTLKEERKAK